MSIKPQTPCVDHLRAYQVLEILNRNKFEPYKADGLEVIIIGGVAAVVGSLTERVAAAGYGVFNQIANYLTDRNGDNLNNTTLHCLMNAGMALGCIGTFSCYFYFNGRYQRHYRALNLQILKNYKCYQRISNEDLEKIKANANRSALTEILNYTKKIRNRKTIPQQTLERRLQEENKILNQLFTNIISSNDLKIDLRECRKVFGNAFFNPVVTEFLKTKLLKNQEDILKKIHAFATNQKMHDLIQTCENCPLNQIKHILRITSE